MFENMMISSKSIGRSIIVTLSLGFLASATGHGGHHSGKRLRPFEFNPVDTGSIKPEGWLRGETEAMASGLPGHLHDFYFAVADSAWLRPQSPDAHDYGSINEGFAYWFNGIVGLAYALDDERLKMQVHSAAETVLAYQTEDGWIGPEIPENRNLRGRMPFFWGLMQLAEANSTWEKPVVNSLRRFFPLVEKMLEDDSFGYVNCAEGIVCYWGQVRSADMHMVLHWLLERYPDDQAGIYWHIMEMLFEQNTYRWEDWYTEEKYPKVYHNPDTTDLSTWPFLHGVNVGEAFKYFAVHSRWMDDSRWKSQSKSATEMAMRYHGASSGAILGDEAERHLGPFTAHELCTVVEMIYSFSYMYSVLGDNADADRAERAAFNAYPVMMTGDKWGHQYMSQPNGPRAMNVTRDFTDLPKPFTNANSGLALVYGLESNFPCCTVNHPQGYPRFISGSWVHVGDRGVGHALLSPSTIKTRLGRHNLVAVSCETNYPFSDRLKYTVHADRPFDLFLRVPGWADVKRTSISVHGHRHHQVSPDGHTGMHKVSLPAGKSTVHYHLGSTTYTEQRPNNTISVFHGSIVYALDLGYRATTTKPYNYTRPAGPPMDGFPEDVRDTFIDFTKPWNIAIDPDTLKYHGMDEENEKIPDPIFEHNRPPTYFTVKGCTIDWPLYMDSHPDWAPEDRTCTGPIEEHRLIPLGGAKIHMTDLPIVSF